VNLLGFEIKRRKALDLRPVDGRGGWFSIVRESFPGAWQQNVEVRLDNVLSYTTVFRCRALISSDIAKLRIRIVKESEDGIWLEHDSPAFSSLLLRPNNYQTPLQFFETWFDSKLCHGNTYVLKERDNRNVVSAMHVLNPQRVKTLVSPMGEVYYELMRDDLAGVDPDVASQTPESRILPASEIIHDRFNCLFHPLVGQSPIYACGLAAVQGLKIQNQSTHLFSNFSLPSGVITAPGGIRQDTAERVKSFWDSGFAGENAGKVAVLGDGMEYKPITMTAVDAQLIDQLKWTSEMVCTAFGVPPYMAGIGPSPLNNNVEALQVQYYSQCLQTHIENCEALLDQGLKLPRELGVEFDLDGLLRMDTATLVKTETEAIKGSLKTINEGRRRLDLPPKTGGDVIYSQQQYFSLEALAERDANKPFSKPETPLLPPPAEAPNEPDEDEEDERAAAAVFKAFGREIYG
jgi:HK97 family phage portal protein